MEISRYWRSQQQRYRLTGIACPHCEAKLFPVREVCTNCGEHTESDSVVVPDTLIVGALALNDTEQK